MDLISNNQHAEKNNSFMSTKYEWTWDEKHSTSSKIKLMDNDSLVTFNPVYSSGTAVVKGKKPLERGRHHFWEILIKSQIYGTNVMIGVGTENVQLNLDLCYCSLLGQDQESWGFSYKGYIKHDGKKYNYGTTFDENNLIGVHLDTWSGTLQFFLNRKPLGIAFTKLNNIMLYPLISCTMAQCTMKLTCSCSIPVTLQTACLALLTPLQRTYLSKTFPGLRYFSESIFAEILQKSIDYDGEDDIEFPAEHIILDDFDYALVGFGRKKKKHC